jgi:hypothetical protein
MRVWTFDQTGAASCVASPLRLQYVMNATAPRNLTLSTFASASEVLSRAVSSVPAVIAIAPVTSPSDSRPLSAGRGHATDRHHHDASAAADSPSQDDFGTGPHGPRLPTGVGSSSPGGGGAPTSWSTKVALLAQAAASWLRSVTGVSIRLQYPETHRLERPG